MQRGQYIDITSNQRALCNNADGVSVFRTDTQARARQAVLTLDRLIAIRISREDNQFPLPGRFVECSSQQQWRVVFNDQLRLKICPRPETEILVRRSGIAIGTGVKAAAIRVQTPTKRQIRTLVPTQNLAGTIGINVEIRSIFRNQTFALQRLEPVGRIGCRPHKIRW